MCGVRKSLDCYSDRPQVKVTVAGEGGISIVYKLQTAPP